ncbi:MAG: Cys-Gln thioester bond-forming surface protein, partial [Oscillibacter sp.]|nr:Cys-Gln thioester bond-forming surface protein [Oscillibacter sp.]
MSKRIITALLAVIMLLGMFSTTAFAASTEEEALGEVDIYNGGSKYSYLAMNGKIQTFVYTYFYYESPITGAVKEIPAYCVNPTVKGVPQTVAEGESIKYLADEKASDPKLTGIVASGYPTRGLAELGLENKAQAYYATKFALWCYIIPGWDINKATVNPNLTGLELERAQKMLAAAKDIYRRGSWWTNNPSPSLTTLADREEAYPVTINGKQYKQQVFTVNSETWICDYTVNVSFADPDSVPEGTRIVDMNNRDITKITTTTEGGEYAGKFKVLYPVESIEGQSGSIQLNLDADVYQYAVFYATCAEVDEYGNLQNYMCDTDPTRTMEVAALSSYGDDPPVEIETGLEIMKVSAGEEVPLSGAVFEIIGPDGDVFGSYSTDSSGRILVELTMSGTYTVTEKIPPRFFLPAEEPTQTVTVSYGEVAKVTFANEPYGSLRIEKVDSI